ncbi:MAG: pyrroline-5-carboxylate reductase [Acidobacteriota bacterium]|nr:pyrroline-5-carboxylate reductase [Acidobacteriota bacterium]
MRELAILGGGFMGGALAEGLVNGGTAPDDIIVAELLDDRRKDLGQRLGVATTADPARAAAEATTVLVAVKPQDITAVLEAVADHIDATNVVVSICAGITTKAFESALGKVAVIRAMPNTPAAIGAGATAIAPGRFAGSSHLALARSLLEVAGEVVVVAESQMDAVTAVSGSGPAYLFYLAEAMIEAAQTEGLSEQQASALVTQTLVGASRLLAQDAASPSELRARVTSPGGTTQAALESMAAAGVKEAIVAAVGCARQRSEELGS